MTSPNKYEIYTDRLILRQFKEEDYETYYNILNQEQVSVWLGDRKRKTKQDIINILENYERSWNKNNFGVFAVIEKESQQLIGHCGIRILGRSLDIELLYAFDPSFWGKGYATESANAVAKWAREELKLNGLVAIVYSDNEKSCNVLEKVGFRYKGIQNYFGSKLSLYEIYFD